MMMQKSLLAGCLVGFVALSAGAQAQDYLSPVPMTTTRPKPAPAKKEPERAAAPSGPARPQAIGEWSMTCSTSPTRACALTQQRIDNGTVLISMEFLAIRNGARVDYVLTTTVPLGLRTAPLRLTSLNGQELVTIPGFACVPAGCVFKIALTPALIGVLGSQEALVAPVQTIDGKQLRFGIKGEGLKDALQQIERSLRAG